MTDSHTTAQVGTPSPTTLLACLLVEDHALIAQLLAGALRALPGIGSVTLATTVTQAVSEAAERPLDLLVLDLKLPDGDGTTVLKKAMAWHPQTACIVLSSAAEEFTCAAELAGHVVALIDKTAPLDTFRHAVEAVVRRRLGGQPALSPADRIRSLRPRERQIFERIGKGMSTRDIAASLGISVHTVNSHRKAIVSRLGVVGAELVRLAALHVATTLADDPPFPASR